MHIVIASEDYRRFASEEEALNAAKKMSLGHPGKKHRVFELVAEVEAEYVFSRTADGITVEDARIQFEAR